MDLKESLGITIKKYNNLKHSATQFILNEIFYSKSEKLYEAVLINIKKSFRNVGKAFKILMIIKKIY